MENLKIIHDPIKRHFSLVLDNSATAFISYQIKDGIHYLEHSEVPSSLRGQGIGKVLVEKTVEYLQANKLPAKAVCSYIRKVVGKELIK